MQNTMLNSSSPLSSMGQQTSSSTPPNTMTSKDLSYMKDQLSWLLGAVKKSHHYASECTDPEVRSMIQRVCQTHERQYQTLLQTCEQYTQQQSTGNTAQA